MKNRLKEFRFKNGEMTQDNMARIAGVSRQTINAIEAGKYSPTLELAFKIAEIFKVDLAEVFQYK